MKKDTISVFTFILMAVLVSGCALTPASVPPTLTPIPPTNTPEPTATPIIYDNVKIGVADEEGNPIPGAKIIQGDVVEFTDNQGVWNKSIQASEFSVGVWAQGYLLQTIP